MAMAISRDKGPSGLTYTDSGVDIDKGNALVESIKPLARGTARPGAGGELGGFGGLFDLKAAGFHDPVLVAANDGVGTKVKIAIETNIHGTIGIDLVAMCVNDLIVQGAEPLFFLDYFASGVLDRTVAESVIGGIAEGCVQAGAALIGGETAEMPGLYSGHDYDLAGFAVGAAERGSLLPRGDIAAGDVLVGLRSSGLHSNGFSLVRQLVSNEGLDWDAPAPFAPDQALGPALLTPTKIYVSPVLKAIKDTGAIKAIAHITGGGLIENLPRVLPKHVAATVDLSTIEPQPVYSWIKNAGGLDAMELLRTFNCGIGLVIVTSRSDVDRVRAVLAGSGETAVPIGELVERQDGKAIGMTGALEFAE